MKTTKPQLKQIIKEELKSDEALLRAIENLADKIEDLDISVDFLSAAFVGGDPLSIGHAQKSIGRAYRPSMRRSHEPLQHEHTKITEAILKELIREELQPSLNEQEITRKLVTRMQGLVPAAQLLVSRLKALGASHIQIARAVEKEFPDFKPFATKLARGEELVPELKELQTLMEELTRTDKAEIKTLISKELDKTLKKEVKKVLEDELPKALDSKATKEEIAEITKKVMKKLYKDLSYHHPYIIDRIKV
jgi:uncharacterized protein (DUF885 family)